MAGPSSGPLVPSLPGINRSDLKNQTLVNLLSTIYVLVMELDSRNKESDGKLVSLIKDLLCARHITHVISLSVHISPWKDGILSPYTKKGKAARLAKGVTQVCGLSCVPKKHMFKS